MNKNITVVFSITSLLALLFMYSSCECNRKRCAGESEQIEVRFLKDGKDILFDDVAIVPLDSFSLHRGTTAQAINFQFDTHKKVVVFRMDQGDIQIIAPGIEEKTLAAEFVLFSEGKCCDDYNLSKLTLDGTLICDLNCTNEPIEISLDL